MVETASRDQERTQDTHGGASETGTMERQCEGGERSDAILIRQKARLPTRTHCVLSIARIFRKKEKKRSSPVTRKWLDRMGCATEIISQRRCEW